MWYTMKTEAAIKEGIAEGLQLLVMSNPAKGAVCTKVKASPVKISGRVRFQVEEYRNNQVFHKNCEEDRLYDLLTELFSENSFGQVEITSAFSKRTVLIGRSGTETVRCRKTEGAVQLPVREHNRTKRYLLPEGTPVPFLTDLGVMTSDGKIVKAYYDKYRQINRFLEFVEDIIPALPKDKELRILDFGCGKSYLTFALYYYFHEVLQLPIRITGLDLKKDVIAECNRLAGRYGYDKLEFLCGDIADYNGTDSVDMVVTLHACDTATDYALWKAIRWNASVILSVPCCQHEWNRQMECEPLEAFTRYGIIRERMSALMTDAFRGNVLEACGYKTQVLEFIEMEHTPKNLLLRAVKQKKVTEEERICRVKKELQPVLSYTGTKPTLYRLLVDETER